MPDDVVPIGERIYGDERRNLQQVSLLEEVADGIDVLSQHFDHFITQLRKLSGQGDFGPLLAEITALSGKLDLLVPPSPEGIADALAKRLPQDMTPEIAAALQAATKNLERLNKKVSAMSIMPSGGSSGHVIVDSGQISSIAQPVEIQNEIGNPIGVSFPKPTYKVANALVSVPAGAVFTTVVEATPTVAFTVQGFAADLNSTAALTYRYRLITGTDASPTVIDMEQISAGDNSKRALLLSVAANTRVAIQVNHAEITAQEFRATLNWSEES